jgi:hypothetical protein
MVPLSIPETDSPSPFMKKIVESESEKLGNAPDAPLIIIIPIRSGKPTLSTTRLGMVTVVTRHTMFDII